MEMNKNVLLMTFLGVLVLGGLYFVYQVNLLNESLFATDTRIEELELSLKNLQNSLNNLEKEETVQLYSINLVLSHDFYTKTEDIPEILDLGTYELYDNQKNGPDYYDGGYLYVFGESLAEDISCEIKEYYDGDLNDNFFVNIEKSRGYERITIGYEKDNLPTRVKYDLDCEGRESFLKYSTSYATKLIVN